MASLIAVIKIYFSYQGELPSFNKLQIVEASDRHKGVVMGWGLHPCYMILSAPHGNAIAHEDAFTNFYTSPVVTAALRTCINLTLLKPDVALRFRHTRKHI